ncbi:DUF7669 domain-containing protein [Paenibacillus bouchesdurhonensis]
MNIKSIKSEQGEYITSTEKIGSYEDLGVASSSKVRTNINSPRWNQPIKIKDAVHEAVQTITNNDLSKEFRLSDVYNELVKQYPDINRSTVDCQVYCDCVNHTSRRHYPSGQKDLYYRTGKGVYRLYNKSLDGEWDWEGKQIGKES